MYPMSETTQTTQESKPKRKRTAKKVSPAELAVSMKLTTRKHGKVVPDQWKVRRVARSLGFGVGRGGAYSLTAPQQKAIRKAIKG
jgi:hypothetical protein